MKTNRTNATMSQIAIDKLSTQFLGAALILLVSCISPPSAYCQATVTPFAPGLIPTSAPSAAAPAFTPHGDVVYFGQAADEKNSIVFSQRKGGDWSAPTTAAFSGRYRDLEPAFVPNGRYLIFASSRPSTPDGAELEGRYNGQTLPGKGGNLWKVEWKRGHWQKPEPLPAVINSNSSVFSPSITADGSLYFMRADDGGKFHIYRAPMKGGRYEAPQLASFSNNPDYGDYDPAVAPDESFLIFSSGRPPAPKTTDLFIVFRAPQGWSDPIDLRSALSENVYGIEARLSPDAKTLYFSNSRNASGANVQGGRYIWKVDLSDLLRRRKN